jgi:hypothetical protein
LQYRIEFLDDANKVVRVTHAEASCPANAFLVAVEKDWPPDAVMARVFDKHGRRGPSVSRPHADQAGEATCDHCPPTIFWAGVVSRAVSSPP